MTQRSAVARHATTLGRRATEVAEVCRSLPAGDAPRWNIGRGRPVLSPMDVTPHRESPADLEPLMPTEAELLAALARSDAKLASGQIVSGDEVLRELDESIARMEA